MNPIAVDPNQLSLTECQIAALVVEENVGSVRILNIDILKKFNLTNRLACLILCALSRNQQNQQQQQLLQLQKQQLLGNDNKDDLRDEEIDLFADYCRQNSINLTLLQALDDDFISDNLLIDIDFKKFWIFCKNLASTDLRDGLFTIGQVLFTRVWQHNPKFQLRLIANCIEQNLIPKILYHPQQNQLSQLVQHIDLLKCQPDFESMPELNNWKYQCLYQILIDFTLPIKVPNLQMNSNFFAIVLELLAWPVQHCPDLTVLGLLGVTGQASPAKVETLSSTIPAFLNASHPNAAIILHSIWSNNSSVDTSALTQQKPSTPITWSQHTLLQALSDHYIKSPPEEQQQRLSRILDVAQDIKTLFRLLDGTCYPFVIDLACLASRREYLKLDKWLMDKLTENGENFIRALVSFLSKRYAPILSGSNKDATIGPVTVGGSSLPAETLAVMLAFLQQCVVQPTNHLNTPMTTELSQTVKKEVFSLIGNSTLLLQRAPRQPPPGVVTSIPNDQSRTIGFQNMAHDLDMKQNSEFSNQSINFRNNRAPQPLQNKNIPLTPVARPSIANNANIDSLIAAGNSVNYPIPPEVVQDKVFFIVNNLSLMNLKQKAEEFKELFDDDDTYYGWIAQYFATKRAAIEQNFQPLYANFLYELDNDKLLKAITRETYRNIKLLLRVDKKVDNISDRTLLKNLGQWLGLLTLARNKPILHIDLDLKGLLVEAYHKGTHELLYVVPFLAEILKTTQKSKIFKPKNPFVLGLLRALVELRQQPNLKLNLEFQVEVLFNNLNIELTELIGQSNILNDDKYYSRIESQLGNKQPQPAINQSGQQHMQQGIKPVYAPHTPPQQQVTHPINNIAMRQPDGTSLSPLNTPPLVAMNQPNVNSGVSNSISSLPLVWSGKFKYCDFDVTNTTTLNHLITVQPSLNSLFSLHPNAKAAVRPAIESAISEWLPSVLERSLKICLPTAEQIIRKDFSLHPDDTHMQAAAHCLIRHLVSYMAMISCRDSDQLEASLATNLKLAFSRTNLRADQAEQAATVLAADNLDLARAFIVKAAIEKALTDLDKLLKNDYELRRVARMEGRQYYDPQHLALHTKLISDGIRLKTIPVPPEQLRIYEEIGQNLVGFKKNEGFDPALAPEQFFEMLVQNQLSNMSPSVLDEQLVLLTETSMNPTLAIRFVQRLGSNFNETNLPKTAALLARMKPLPSQPQIDPHASSIETVQSSTHNQANYLLQSAALPVQSINSNPQLPNSTIVVQRDTLEGDPPGLLEKTDKLLRDWVNIHQSGQANKMFPIFVQQMTANGILKTDDLVTRFFRLSTEMCVESCYRLFKSQSTNGSGTNSVELRTKCYEALDAFTNLIVLLIKNSSSSSPTNLNPDPAAKINLLSKILSIIVNVAIRDQETRQAEFQHLAYYRILILLFIELNLSPTMLGLPPKSAYNFNRMATGVDVLSENVQFQVLNEFAKTLRALRPSKVPSFSFAWLDFLAHRLFAEKCLAGFSTNRANMVFKGWALYAQLLIDLIKFEAPFLRNVELPPSVDLLYKGTLKVFLVLLHDFPEFLCEYCYSLCDVIPCNAIQLRNLVLSAFPRRMRLPDPFTPNLKIDQLPEMAQPPKIENLQVNLIQSASFRDDLDNYLRTKTPANFPSTLIAHLRDQSQNQMVIMSTRGSVGSNSINVPLLNALVLYLGRLAIAAIPRSISMNSISATLHMEIFQYLATNLDTEGRYLFLNAIANQLRYPNSHTHYFSCALLYLFVVASNEQIQEQITRVLVERLIIMRPHPWGLLVTFIELIKNPLFKFWKHEFVRCAPEIEK